MKCESSEDPSSCKDCFCGDGVCSRTETMQSCAKDCGVIPPKCPNGVCDFDETQQSCPADCGMQDTCGNGKCEAGEETSCARDCCGDGICSRLERFFCVSDCGTTCGDKMCQLTDFFLCPEECPVGGGGLPLPPPPLGAPGTPIPAQ
jgi:hypothetical protein